MADKLNTSKESIGPTTIADSIGERKSTIPKADYAISNAGNTFLLLPKMSSSAINRSGSCKQLFKQHALDEDPDMIDESSLLLPVLTSNTTNALSTQQHLDYKNAKETSLFTKDTNDKIN